MEYADDVCLVSHKYDHMCRKLDDLWKESKKNGLEINSSKTEEIRVNTIVKQRLRLNGEDIKRSLDFYLGIIVGNRKTGRPRNRWRRSVIKEAGRSWNELRFLAADRQKWKGLIDNLCS